MVKERLMIATLCAYLAAFILILEEESAKKSWARSANLENTI